MGGKGDLKCVAAKGSEEMRARVLLLALGGFTLVNAAITFYLVRTMWH